MDPGVTQIDGRDILKALITVLVVCGMASGLSAQEYSGESVPKTLRTAKTVYIVNNGAYHGYAGAVDALTNELLQWGRFTVVDSVAASDIDNHDWQGQAL